jgi:hypothetical protein
MPNPGRVASLIGGLLFASSAHAADSWVIFTGGETPNREAWVVDAQSLADRSDLVGFLQRATPAEQNAYLKQLRRREPAKPGDPVAGPEPVYESRSIPSTRTRPNRIDWSESTG